MQNSQDGTGEYYTSGVIANMLKYKVSFRILKVPKDCIKVVGIPSQLEEFCKQNAKVVDNKAFFCKETGFYVVDAREAGN